MQKDTYTTHVQLIAFLVHDMKPYTSQLAVDRLNLIASLSS